MENNIPENNSQNNNINNNSAPIYNPNKSPKKNNSLLLFLIIILIGVFAFFAYKFLIEDKKETENKETNKLNNQEVEKISTELLNNIIHKTRTSENGIYEINKRTSDYGYDHTQKYYPNQLQIINNWETKTKVYHAIEFVDKNKIVSTEKIVEQEPQRTSIIKLSDFKETYQNIFGKDKEVPTPDFYSDSYGNCKVINDTYTCVLGTVGGMATCSTANIKVTNDKVKLVEDELHIYEKGIYIGCEEGEYYKTEDLFKEDINNPTFENRIDLQIKELKGININTLLNDSKYDSQLVRFRHIFKKNSDGTYYLYSNERVS